MNIVVFSNRWARPHHFELGHPVAMAAALLATVLLFGGAFLAGIRWAGTSVAPVAMHASSIPAAVLPTGNDAVNEQLEDLAARVGQVNAQILRLNALGKRLTEMAHLDKGEFNFEAPPAQGGPEEVSEPAEVADGLAEVLARLETQLIDRERQLVILETFISARQLTQMAVPDGNPVPGAWVSSTFGRRSDPFTGRYAFHSGIDFAAPSGATANAVAPGVVTWAGERAGYGRLLEINHGNGYVTRYGHNSSLLVRVGDRVAKGQAVSRVGSTGRSTGPHLHFEVMKNGTAIDPARFVGG